MAFTDLSDPAAVIAAMRECDAIGRTAFLKKYGFGKSKDYMVFDSETGTLYDSKALAGVAHGHQFPVEGVLKPSQFSGGEATVESKMKALGFDVVHIGENWTASEVAAVVLDYFEMLASERSRADYNKAQHNEALRKKLKSRTKASIELKHQNISAILDEVGLPYIEGYKPRYNYQGLLKEVVLDFINSQSESIAKRVISPSEVTIEPAPVRDWQSLLVEPPKPQIGRNDQGRKRPRLPKKLDYVARDEQNRTLGEAGEKWVIQWERRRLESEGRFDLAQRIEWVSKTQGDGTGFDIQSYNADETLRYIEVKTTNGNVQTPFLISRNEVNFSQEESQHFYLYRVFNFRSDPRLYILSGDLEECVSLVAQEYRASPK